MVHKLAVTATDDTHACWRASATADLKLQITPETFSTIGAPLLSSAFNVSCVVIAPIIEGLRAES